MFAAMGVALVAIGATQGTPVVSATPAPAAAGDLPTVSSVYSAGSAAAWVIEQGGIAIGHAWWDYRGPEPDREPSLHRFSGGWKIATQSALGLLELRASGDVLVDDGGHPRELAIRGETAGTTTALELRVADGRATGSMTVGPKTTPIDLAVDPAAYLLLNNWIGLLDLVVRVARPADGAITYLPLLHPESGKVLDYQLRSLGSFEVRRGEATVSGQKYRDSIGEMLRVLPDGSLYEVEVLAQGIRMRRTDEPVERFTLAAAPTPLQHDFLREEVRIERGGWQLAGSITQPKRADAGAASAPPARLPAVFFVSGSGLQDRDGMAGGIDLGTHELLDHLTDAGFLVLRVDDRGAGASGGPLEGLTFDALVDDARACVDFLLTRPDVDPARVFVIGHSEGGVTAPVLACERPLRGIVLMAAPGRGLCEILREQKRNGLEAAGLPKPLIEQELAEHAKFLALATGDGEVRPEDVRLDYRPALKDREWFRSHARHDPLAQIAQVEVPVLIVQGGKDVQVSAERDAPALLAALQAAGHPDATLALFPQLDHLFKAILAATPTTADYLKARPVDPEFLTKVTAWLRAHSTP